MSLAFKIQKPNKQQTHTQHTQRQSINTLNSSDEESTDHRLNPTKRPIEFISDFDSTRRPTNPDDEKTSNPISIPALPDRDFRAVHLARKQRRLKKEMYKPEQAKPLARTSKDTINDINDLEGLDKMNSKTIEGGLKAPVTVTLKRDEELPLETSLSAESTPTQQEPQAIEEKPQTIEERAVKELLSQANGSQTKEPIEIQAIQMTIETTVDSTDEDLSDSGDETAQFRRDVSKRPDSSTLEDYERIPVGQFGLALLKGMGWKEGTAATKRGRVGLVEAYVAQPRPSLLGIGAKPLAAVESDPTNKNTRPVRPDKKYVPLLRKVIDNGGKTDQRPRSRSPNQDSSSTSAASRSRHDQGRSSYQDSRKHEASSHHKDHRDKRDDRSRRDYSDSDSNRRDQEDRSNYRPDSRKYDSSRQRDSHRERDERSRRDDSDDDRSSDSRHHRYPSHSHHRHNTSSSHRNHHHESNKSKTYK